MWSVYLKSQLPLYINLKTIDLPGKSMAYQSSRDNQVAVIRTLGFVIAMFMFLTVYLLISSTKAKERAFIDIPAYSLGSKNETVALNTMHKTTVYSFAQMVFQRLNQQVVRFEKSIA